MPEDVSWKAIDFRDGRFALAGSNGAIALSDDGRTFRQVAESGQSNGEGQAADLADIVMLSRQQLIALDQDGGFSVSNDSGESWLKSSIDTGMKSTVIALAGKDKILSADSAGQLGLAELVAEIQLDSPLKDGQYQAGDQIFLEKTAVEVPDSYLAATDWHRHSQGSAGIFMARASAGAMVKMRRPAVVLHRCCSRRRWQQRRFSHSFTGDRYETFWKGLRRTRPSGLISG